LKTRHTKARRWSSKRKQNNKTIKTRIKRFRKFFFSSPVFWEYGFYEKFEMLLQFAGIFAVPLFIAR